MLKVERRGGDSFGEYRRSRDETPQKRQKTEPELLAVQTVYRGRSALDSAIQGANHKIEIAA